MSHTMPYILKQILDIVRSSSLSTGQVKLAERANVA